MVNHPLIATTPSSEKQQESAATTIGSAVGVTIGLERGEGERRRDEAEKAVLRPILGEEEKEQPSSPQNTFVGKKTGSMTSSSLESITIATPSVLKNKGCSVEEFPEETNIDDSSTGEPTFQDQLLHQHRQHPLQRRGGTKNGTKDVEAEEKDEEDSTGPAVRDSKLSSRDEKTSSDEPPRQTAESMLLDGSASDSEGRSRRTSLSSMALDSSLGDEIADAIAVATATEATNNDPDHVSSFGRLTPSGRESNHNDDHASMDLLPILEGMETAVKEACHGKIKSVGAVKACLAAFAVVLSDFAGETCPSNHDCDDEGNDVQQGPLASNEPPQQEESTEVKSPTTTTVHRPPVPLTAAQAMWRIILRKTTQQNGANLNDSQEDLATASPSDVDHQLAIVEDILVHNLEFLNVAESQPVEAKEERETKFQINLPTFSDILARQMNDDAESLNLDSVLSPSQNRNLTETVQDTAADGSPEIYVRINDDNVLYFGRYLAQEYPELFRPEKKEDPNVQDSVQWNAGVELNGLMVHVAMQVLEDALSASKTIANHMSTPLLRYLLEMLPLHMMRCRQYGEVAKVLARRDFVELRLRTVGLRDGTAMCVADAEELKLRITQDKSERSSAILTRSYSAVMHYIRRATKRPKRGTVEAVPTPSPPLPPISAIDTAQALRSMAESLSKHGLRGDAMTYNSRAVVHYERARSTAAMTSAACQDNDSAPSLDEIQLIMAEILNEMALVHDGRGHHTDAMLCFERALSFYSQRQTPRHSRGVSSTLRLMGMHHFQLQEHDLALACFDDIVSLLRPDPSKADEVGDIIQWAGNTLREGGRYNDALAKFAEALGLKMLLHGSGHADVARIHHSMGCVNDDLSKFSASLSHYNEALLIWRSLLRDSKEADPQSKEVGDQEVQIVETLKCIGNVHGIHCHHVAAYRCYQECSEIFRCRVSASVSSITASTIKSYLEEDPEAAAEVERWHECLLLALQMARSALLNGGGMEPNAAAAASGPKDEVEDGLADVLYDLGVIHSANSALGVNGDRRGDQDNDDDNDDASEKEKAERHLLECASLRQRQQDNLYMKCAGMGASPDDLSMLLLSQAKAAFALYELGNLYCPSLLRICQLSSSTSYIRRLRRAVGAASAESCRRAINFLQEARGVIRKAMDTPEFPPMVQDDMHITIQLLPSKYEAVMEKLGRLHRALGQFDEAEESYQEMVTILGHSTLVLPDDDDEHDANNGNSRQVKKLKFLQNIGDTLLEKGRVEFAEKKYLEALELSKEIDEDSIATAALLYPIGEIHLEAKRWEEASRCVSKAMHILRAHLGEAHSDVALCLNRLGRASEGRKQVAEAFSYYRSAMQVVKDKVDDKDADLSVADVFFDFGRMVLLHEKKAKWSTQQEEEGGELEATITDDLLSLAHHGAKMACARYKLELGDKSRDTADACSLAGEFSEKSGDYEVAVSYFADALRVYRRLRGAAANDAKVARTLEKIGLLHFNHGNDRDKALKCFDLAIRLLKQKNRTASEDFAELLFSKGSVYFENDEAHDALLCYKEALGTYEQLLGRGHVKIAVVLERIGWCLVKTREHKNAMLYFEEALHVRNLHEEDGDLDNADIWFGMGIIHCENGSYQDALDAYKEALGIWRATLGDSHMKVAHVLNNVGSVIARQKDYQQAIHHWERAVEIYKSSGLSNDHPTVACTMGNIEISRRFVTIAQSRRGSVGGGGESPSMMMNSMESATASHEGSRESITKMWSSLL